MIFAIYPKFFNNLRGIQSEVQKKGFSPDYPLVEVNSVDKLSLEQNPKLGTIGLVGCIAIAGAFPEENLIFMTHYGFPQLEQNLQTVQNLNLRSDGNICIFYKKPKLMGNLSGEYFSQIEDAQKKLASSFPQSKVAKLQYGASKPVNSGFALIDNNLGEFSTDIQKVRFFKNFVN